MKIITKTIAFAIFLSCSFLSIAQSGQISGKVVDNKTQMGLPFATVSVFELNGDSLINGVTTNIDGEFSLSGLPYGNHRVQISYMGYNEYNTEVSLSRAASSFSLQTITLSPSELELEGVEITAMASTVSNRIDRRTYRAVDFETARGGTAADVLNRLPSVSVSPDGDVSVRGTTDFIVYLNGRPTQLDPSVLLAQLQAINIESIDVITVPSAQYDAQGKGGIINITTRRSGLEGFSVSATGQLGGAPWGNRTDNISGYNLTDNNFGGGASFTYTNGGLLLFGGVNYSWRDVNSSRSGAARILNPENGSYKHMIASGMKPEWHQNFSASLGFDARLTKNSQLSASYFHGQRTEGRQALYLYNMFTADQYKNPMPGYPLNEQWVFNPNEGIRKGLFHTFHVDYTLRPTETSKFGLALLYEHSILTHDVDNPNIFYNPMTTSLEGYQLHYKQIDRTPLDGLRFSVDFTKEFNNGNSLTVGLQPYFLGISGGLKYDTLNVESNNWGAYTSLENQIELERNIYAGFVDYSGSIGKFNYKAGLRFEYTDQVMEIDNPNYFSIFDRPTESRNVVRQLDWFPSLHASYPLNATDNISLAASRRISRSPVKSMAPFLFRRHLEVYVVGDPTLKPEYINNLELTYSKSINNQRLTFTGFFRGVDNAVFRVNTVYAQEMVLIRSFTNAGETQSIGLELNANLDLGSKAKAFVGGSVYDYRVQADIFGFQEDQRSLSWSVKSMATFVPTKAMRLSADLDIRSAQVTAQGRNELRYLVNAAASYTPAKLKGWSFTARGLNLLNSNKNSLGTRAYNSEGVQIFYQDTEFYWYGPILEISMLYNFNWKGQARRTGSEFGREEF